MGVRHLCLSYEPRSKLYGSQSLRDHRPRRPQMAHPDLSGPATTRPKAHISQWNDPWPYTEVQAYLTSRLRERDLGCHESGPTIHMQAAARSNALWSDRLFFNLKRCRVDRKFSRKFWWENLWRPGSRSCMTRRSAFSRIPPRIERVSRYWDAINILLSEVRQPAKTRSPRARLRLARKPKCRIRTKPLGGRCT